MLAQYVHSGKVVANYYPIIKIVLKHNKYIEFGQKVFGQRQCFSNFSFVQNHNFSILAT